jgi:hypothetical protein
MFFLTLITNQFFNAAARASEGMARRIGPTRERQCGRLRFFLFQSSVSEQTITSLGEMMLRFSVGCTAMFAEPTVTEIEEVVGLIHEVRGQKAVGRKQKPEDGV